jgi:PAS domain S-box-containing protein
MNEIIHQILILDDDQPLAEMMADYLNISANSQVELTHTENDFWNMLSQKEFDIIFLDYRLPNITGLDILEKLAAKQNLIPVVMMTGEGNEQIAAKAIQSGAFDYLVKGHYPLNILPSLVQKAVRLRSMQNEVQRYLHQIQYQSMLLNNMRDAVVVWGVEGNITYWNYSAEKLFGVQYSERINTSVYENYFNGFTPPIEQPDPKNVEATETERQYRGVNNETIWISSRITPLFDQKNGNQLTGYMDVARDITARKLEQQALNETRHFLEQIITSSPDLIYIYNLQTYRMTFVNPKMEKLLGYTADQIYNKGDQVLIDLAHPEDLPLILAHFKHITELKINRMESIEFRMREKTGKWHWFSSHESIFSHTDQGVPLEIIGIAQDISIKKAVENQLQQRLVMEKLLSSISNFFINLSAQNTDVGVEKSLLLIGNYIRPDFGAIYLLKETDTLEYYCGFEKSVADSKRIQQKANFIYTNQIPWLMERLKQQENTQIARLDELPNEAFREKLFFNERAIKALIAIPLVYNNELVGAMSLMMTHHEHDWVNDHTNMLQTFGEMVVNALVQKWSEEALRTSEARYRAIVEEHQTELICRVNAHLDLNFVNETFTQYYLRSRESLIGLNCKTFIHPEDYQEVNTSILKCSPQSPVTRFECRVYKQSKIRWQEWTIRAIYNETNEILEYQGVGRDISDRKLIEAQLQIAQTHLTQNSRMAAIGELASSVAHQISNPLTTIIAEAQLLTHALPADNSGIESAEAIIKAGWRAQHVIQELLKFSERPKSSKELLDINETIEKAIFLAGAHIQASGSTQLIVKLSKDLPTIRGNIQQLEDLWVTLLLLARAATADELPHTVEVSTTLATNGKDVQIEISDDGIPVSEEDIDTIFEPKLIPTGLGRGTGIELSVCREIVRQHQGKISAKINQGLTIFEINFPGEVEAYGTN